MRISTWVAVAGLVSVGASGCRRELTSRGTCAGAVGEAQLAAPLTDRSAYEMSWSDPGAATLVKLDCGGRLVLYAELAHAPRGQLERWKLAGEGKGSTAAPGFQWELSAPKTRPRVATGSFEASLGDDGALRGKTELRFEDETVARIDFALAGGHFSADLPHAVDVSAIPGRISFTRQ